MKTEPTEALKEIKRCSWEVDFNISDGLESYEVVDKDDAINIANIAFKEGQSNPKIKQLEWNFYGLNYDVETAFGRYIILQGDEQYLEDYNTCTLIHNSGLIADFNSIDEAKAAAQRDFEQRVKECLDLKAQQKQALIDMMRGDEEIGLYDDNPKNHGYER
jgi:hypothetical protein